MSDPVRIEADYLLETAFDPRAAAEAMAGEQSSGTFVPVPGETPELKARAAARVEALEVVGEVGEPSLPGAGLPKGGAATCAAGARSPSPGRSRTWGPSLPNLLATVAGNLFELQQLSGLRLLDLRPAAGLRRRLSRPAVRHRGHAPARRRRGAADDRHDHQAERGPRRPRRPRRWCGRSCEAGIDFIKDDELMADGPHCPFDERARAVMRVVDEHADRTGKKVMFAFNITDEIDADAPPPRPGAQPGGTCVMVSLNSVGLVGMAELAPPRQLRSTGTATAGGCSRATRTLGWSSSSPSRSSGGWRASTTCTSTASRNKFCETDDQRGRARRGPA